MTARAAVLAQVAVMELESGESYDLLWLPTGGCSHVDTVCAECAPEWANDYQLDSRPRFAPSPAAGGGAAAAVARWLELDQARIEAFA